MPQYKLGKLPARTDYRTLKFTSVLRALPPVPVMFDVDSQYPFIKDN